MADLKHKRGTKKTHSIRLTGDHTNRELSFVVKNGLDDTADRIIEKLKSREEISVSYDSTSNISTCQIELTKTDTVDLPVRTYPWDIDSINPDDAEDVETVEGGNFILVQDVQTPFDGFALPSSATRFLQIDARDFPVDIMIITDTIDGVVVFRTITLEELKQKLDQII